MKRHFLPLLLLAVSAVYAQPNCEAFKYYGDTLKYEACLKAMEIRGHYQFSKEYQMTLDESIEIDSTFDYAYWAKSIAYLKSGDFVTWKKLIDKAVELNPEEHLGYRGWCRYQFFNDYQGTIADLEKLDSLIDYDIGFSQNGRYHLNIARGLCYKALGEMQKAREILETQIRLNEEKNLIGYYDYLHLGVLYLESGEVDKAIEAFSKQSQVYEMAENQYYLALAWQRAGKIEQYRSGLEQARELYIAGTRMMDSYSTPMDKIYLATIDDELARAAGSD